MEDLLRLTDGDIEDKVKLFRRMLLESSGGGKSRRSSESYREKNQGKRAKHDKDKSMNLGKLKEAAKKMTIEKAYTSVAENESERGMAKHHKQALNSTRYTNGESLTNSLLFSGKKSHKESNGKMPGPKQGKGDKGKPCEFDTESIHVSDQGESSDESSSSSSSAIDTLLLDKKRAKKQLLKKQLRSLQKLEKKKKKKAKEKRHKRSKQRELKELLKKLQRAPSTQSSSQEGEGSSSTSSPSSSDEDSTESSEHTSYERHKAKRLKKKGTSKHDGSTAANGYHHTKRDIMNQTDLLKSGKKSHKKSGGSQLLLAQYLLNQSSTPADRGPSKKRRESGRKLSNDHILLQIMKSRGLLNTELQPATLDNVDASPPLKADVTCQSVLGGVMPAVEKDPERVDLNEKSPPRQIREDDVPEDKGDVEISSSLTDTAKELPPLPPPPKAAKDVSPVKEVVELRDEPNKFEVMAEEPRVPGESEEPKETLHATKSSIPEHEIGKGKKASLLPVAKATPDDTSKEDEPIQTAGPPAGEESVKVDKPPHHVVRQYRTRHVTTIEETRAPTLETMKETPANSAHAGRNSSSRIDNSSGRHHKRKRHDVVAQVATGRSSKSPSVRRRPKEKRAHKKGGKERPKAAVETEEPRYELEALERQAEVMPKPVVERRDDAIAAAAAAELVIETRDNDYYYDEEEGEEKGDRGDAELDSIAEMIKFQQRLKAEEVSSELGDIPPKPRKKAGQKSSLPPHPPESMKEQIMKHLRNQGGCSYSARDKKTADVGSDDHVIDEADDDYLRVRLVELKRERARLKRVEEITERREREIRALEIERQRQRFAKRPRDRRSSRDRTRSSTKRDRSGSRDEGRRDERRERTRRRRRSESSTSSSTSSSSKSDFRKGGDAARDTSPQRPTHVTSDKVSRSPSRHSSRDDNPSSIHEGTLSHRGKRREGEKVENAIPKVPCMKPKDILNESYYDEVEETVANQVPDRRDAVDVSAVQNGDLGADETDSLLTSPVYGYIKIKEKRLSVDDVREPEAVDQLIQDGRPRSTSPIQIDLDGERGGEGVDDANPSEEAVNAEIDAIAKTVNFHFKPITLARTSPNAKTPQVSSLTNSMAQSQTRPKTHKRDLIFEESSSSAAEESDASHKVSYSPDSRPPSRLSAGKMIGVKLPGLDAVDKLICKARDSRPLPKASSTKDSLNQRLSVDGRAPVKKEKFDYDDNTSKSPREHKAKYDSDCHLVDEALESLDKTDEGKDLPQSYTIQSSPSRSRSRSRSSSNRSSRKKIVTRSASKSHYGSSSSSSRSRSRSYSSRCSTCSSGSSYTNNSSRTSRSRSGRKHHSRRSRRSSHRSRSRSYSYSSRSSSSYSSRSPSYSPVGRRITRARSRSS